MLDGRAVAWGCKGHAGRVCSVGDRVWGVAIRVLPVCGIARPDVHKMSGYARTELWCTFELRDVSGCYGHAQTHHSR